MCPALFESGAGAEGIGFNYVYLVRLFDGNFEGRADGFELGLIVGNFEERAVGLELGLLDG